MRVHLAIFAHVRAFVFVCMCPCFEGRRATKTQPGGRGKDVKIWIKSFFTNWHCISCWQYSMGTATPIPSRLHRRRTSRNTFPTVNAVIIKYWFVSPFLNIAFHSTLLRSRKEPSGIYTRTARVWQRDTVRQIGWGTFAPVLRVRLLHVFPPSPCSLLIIYAFVYWLRDNPFLPPPPLPPADLWLWCARFAEIWLCSSLCWRSASSRTEIWLCGRQVGMYIYVHTFVYRPVNF